MLDLDTESTIQFTPTAGHMEAVHYGIPVGYVGENGGMIALGHHAVYRVLAAFNQHARQVAGYTNALDDPRASATDIACRIRQLWATFRTPDADPQDWHAEWDATQDTPGAVAVTVLFQ